VMGLAHQVVVTTDTAVSEMAGNTRFGLVVNGQKTG
jgi:hypothetical protein